MLLILSVSGSICVHRSSLFSFFFSPRPARPGTKLNSISAEQTEPPWKQKVFIPEGNLLTLLKGFFLKAIIVWMAPDAAEATGALE